MAKILYEDLTGQSHTIEKDVKDIESHDETVVNYVSKRLIQALLENNTIHFAYYYDDSEKKNRVNPKNIIPRKIIKRAEKQNPFPDFVSVSGKGFLEH